MSDDTNRTIFAIANTAYAKLACAALNTAYTQHGTFHLDDKSGLTQCRFHPGEFFKAHTFGLQVLTIKIFGAFAYGYIQALRETEG